jgi:hypothetical protein
MNQKGLTQQQITQQDFVDSAIFNLLQSLNPTDKEIQWDIEMIGYMRDVVKECLVDKLCLMTEQEFYPYLEGKMDVI